MIKDKVGTIIEMDNISAISLALQSFVVVFTVLCVLALIIYALSKVFNMSKKSGAVQTVSSVAEVRTSLPLDSGLTLINTTERDAAMIMAIISDTTQIPLNKLRFQEIKLIS